MSATVFLQVNEDADDYRTDRHSVILHMLCEALNESQSSTSPASTAARVRYDAQNASAYQQHLTHELSMHYVPLLWQIAGVDTLSTALAKCAKTAVCETTPQACKRRGAPARKSEPWYDQLCKDACQRKKHVSECPQSNAEGIQVAQIQYASVICRAKQIWVQQRNDELVEKSNKDSRHVWKVYKTRKRDSLLEPKNAEAFQTLYSTQPAEPPQRPATPGVSASSGFDDECMFASITTEELHVCIQNDWKHGKSPGIDGVSADMVVDGGGY